MVSYSVPFRGRLDLDQLREHTYTVPDHPEWIPYRTSYYSESWGLCLSQRQLEALPEGEYDVCIDTSLRDGHLTYAECYLPGATEDEFLFSCHICHPSLANDNLSGVAVSTFLAERLARVDRRYSYRFLFVPGTIGSLTWLARNEDNVERIRHGLVLACLGDAAAFTFKRSRRGDTEIDRTMEHVLRHAVPDQKVIDFDPYGYDERQYCSPGFDLPVGALSRSRHGTFPEYHTSADNLAFVRPAALGESLAVTMKVIEVVEGNGTYRNLSPGGNHSSGDAGSIRRSGVATPKWSRWRCSGSSISLMDGTRSWTSQNERECPLRKSEVLRTLAGERAFGTNRRAIRRPMRRVITSQLAARDG